jgi:hypothetical protein
LYGKHISREGTVVAVAVAAVVGDVYRLAKGQVKHNYPDYNNHFEVVNNYHMCSVYNIEAAAAEGDILGS